MAGKRVGSLLVDVAMNMAKISNDINTLNRKFDKFGKDTSKAFAMASKAFSGIFSIAVARRAIDSLQQIYTETIKSTDSIAKFSTRIGISTEALSAYHYAAERAGIDTRTFDMALQRMTRRVAEAAVGTGEAKAAIKELGLDAVALRAIGPEKAFMAIVSAMDKVKDSSDKVRLAMKLFDSEGVAMLQLINQGQGALRGLVAEAARLGIVISSDFAKSAEEAADASTKLDAAIMGLKISFAEQLSPSITQATGFLTEAITAMTEMRKEAEYAKREYADLATFMEAVFEMHRTGVKPGPLYGPRGAFRRQQRGQEEPGGVPGSPVAPPSADAIAQARRLQEIQQQIASAKGAESIGSLVDYKQLKASLDLMEQFGDTYMEASAAALEFVDSQKEVWQVTEGLQGVASNMQYGFSSAFEMLITGSGDVKDAFAAMGRGILRTLSDIIAKMLVLMLLEQASKAFSIWKGTPKVQADLGSGYNIADIGSFSPFSKHGGGIIHRMHSGGFAGLRSDEVPAILQTGERVIPRGGDTMPRVEVNVINKGNPMKVSQRTTRIDQRRMVVDLILEEMGENPETGRRFGNLMPSRR